MSFLEFEKGIKGKTYPNAQQESTDLVTGFQFPYGFKEAIFISVGTRSGCRVSEFSSPLGIFLLLHHRTRQEE